MFRLQFYGNCLYYYIIFEKKHFDYFFRSQILIVGFIFCSWCRHKVFFLNYLNKLKQNINIRLLILTKLLQFFFQILVSFQDLMNGTKNVVGWIHWNFFLVEAWKKLKWWMAYSTHSLWVESFSKIFLSFLNDILSRWIFILKFNKLKIVSMILS